MQEYVSIRKFIGLKFEKITISDNSNGISFKDSKGDVYLMYHPLSDKCKNPIHLDGIYGNIDSLLGNRIISAQEVEKEEETDRGITLNEVDSETHAVFRISTVKGNTYLVWCGDSSGLYGDTIDIVRKH